MLTPFGAPTLFVFCPTKKRTEVWRSFFGLVPGRFPHAFRWPDDEGQHVSVKTADDLYKSLDTLPDSEKLNTVVIVDLIDISDEELHAFSVAPDQSSPLERYRGGLRAPELALRYPEIYWIFVVAEVPSGFSERTREFHFVTGSEISRVVHLIDRHGRGFRTWFDPAGFRAQLRGPSPAEVENDGRSGIAIDEEVSYCTFNGYVLYRNGRPTFVVNSHAEMREVLNGFAQSETPAVIEDIELQFDDVPSENGPQGAGSDRRYLVSADNSPEALNAVLKARVQEFPVLSRAEGVGVRTLVSAVNIDTIKNMIGKPYRGMFEEKLGDLAPVTAGDIQAAAKGRKKEQAAKKRQGEAQNLGDQDPHSAPYRGQHVSEELLRRARCLEAAATSVLGAIHAALLAREARLLLKNLTFTLSLEAIAIQYRMEVAAECAFPGAAPSLSPERRFNGLEASIDAVARTLPQKNNSLVAIANGLFAIYQSKSQYAAADFALDRLRVYRWRLRYASRKWQPTFNAIAFAPLRLLLIPLSWVRALLSVVSMPVEAYFNYLMRSFANIVMVCFLWIVAFALVYSSTIRCKPNSVCYSFDSLDWTFHSAATFLALQPGISGQPEMMQLPSEQVASMPQNTMLKPREEVATAPIVIDGHDTFHLFWLITIIEMFLGFLHLGVLVSYLFQRLAR